MEGSCLAEQRSREAIKFLKSQLIVLLHGTFWSEPIFEKSRLEPNSEESSFAEQQSRETIKYLKSQLRAKFLKSQLIVVLHGTFRSGWSCEKYVTLLSTEMSRHKSQRCAVLQCVLQCAAVCCSVLQCVAVCCSVLQFIEISGRKQRVAQS